jgi:DNA-binding beta-propeller fold protein YncE
LTDTFSATITEFDANGTSVRSLAAIGTTPTGLDVDTTGNVYVALSGDNQIAKFSSTTSSFQLDTTFGAGGRSGKSDQTSGTGQGEFNAPYDVAVTKDGQAIYVSDTSNHRIQKFSKDGLFLSVIGAQGSGFGNFNNPKGLSVGKDGTLFVVDSGNNRLVRFMGDEVYKIIGGSGVSLGQYQLPLNIAPDIQGIYVTDTGNNRIQKLDRKTLAPVLQFSSELGLNQPAGVSIADDPVDERLWVADTGNNRVVGIRLPKIDPIHVWTIAKQNLIDGNIEAALSHFSAAKVDSYRQLFGVIRGPKVSQDISAIGQLAPIYIDSDEARYYFSRAIGGQEFKFVITFVNENGTWKIRTF